MSKTPMKLLVPFDGNARSMDALEYAAMFASGMNATITALHIAKAEDYSSKEEFQLELKKIVDQQLRPKLVEIQKTYPGVQKIDLQTRGSEKSLPNHIIDFAAENEIDFIIMRSHGIPDASDWDLHFITTNAYKVILEAQCPVFSFTDIPKQPGMKNILLPIDLSEGSVCKIPLAISLALNFDAHIHLLSASENQNETIELEEQLKKVYTELKSRKVKVLKNEVQPENLAKAITRYCSNSPMDLIIIMSRPGFKWSDLWISPIAKRILAHSATPVLSMRSNVPIDVDI